MPYPALSRIICHAIALVITFTSCTRDTDDVVSPPPDPTDTTQPIDSPVTETLAPGWKEIKLPTDDYIYDIVFYGDTGYCYAGKHLYRSVDGGDNWEKVLFSPKHFGNISMGSAENAVILSAYSTGDLPSTVYFTKNGGGSFDSLTFYDQVTDVFFINRETAFMIGKKFWKTIDGGASWQEVYNFNDPKGEYRSLYFLDELNGFINKYNGAFFTGDGGITWKKLGLDGSAPENYPGSIFFYSEEIGFLTGYHELATYNADSKTIRFYYDFYDYGTAFYHDIHFVSADTGYVTNGRMILKTTDRGNTWKVELKTPAAELCELHFIDAGHGWAAGDNGTIYKYVKP
jgi:photosystem II stability/assembly factor-like uncharacterized protein